MLEHSTASHALKFFLTEHAETLFIALSEEGTQPISIVPWTINSISDDLLIKKGDGQLYIPVQKG